MRKQKVAILLSIIAAVFVCILAGLIFCVVKIAHHPEVKNWFSQTNTNLQAVADLQHKIRDAYDAQKVSVGLNNGDRLIVTLVNSQINKLPAFQIEAMAKEIAVFAYENYRAIDTIRFIHISFVEEKNFFFFHLSNRVEYDFNVADLGRHFDTQGELLHPGRSSV